jgi:Putative Ig domain
MDTEFDKSTQLRPSRRGFIHGTLSAAVVAALGLPIRVAYAAAEAPTIRNATSVGGFDDNVTLPQPVVGNCIYVFVFSISAVTSGITDSAGNTYTFLKNAVDSNGNYTAVFRAPVTAAGSGSLAVSTIHGGMCAIEVANDNGVDGSVTSGTYSGNSGGTASAGAITTTAAAGLILSAAYDQNGVSLSANTGTLVATANTGGDTGIVQAHTTSSAGSYTESFTVPASNGETASMVAVAIMGSGGSSGGGWQLPAGHYVSSPLALKMIAPRSSLTSANRYYKAYPGLLYRVPVSAYGGAWPYQYALSGQPSGMTVGQHYGDTDYGIINWSNPVAGSYSYTVTVTDQAGSTVSSTVSLTVTTSGFLFVDSVNGSPSLANGGTGTGTISNPFKSMNDWYAGVTGGTGSSTKSDSTYANDFVYYRAGSYQTMDCFGEFAVNFANYTRCVLNDKPKVHLGYPGETVYMSTDGNALSSGGLGGQLINYSGSGQAGWFHNIIPSDITPNGGYAFIHIAPSSTDFVFFECNPEPYVGHTSANPCCVMFEAGTGSSNISQYITIRNCAFGGSDTAELVELYSSQYVLCEFCTVSGNVNGGDGGGFYFKQDCRDFSVRANTGLSGNTTSLFRYDNFSNWSADIAEVCWNNYVTSGKALEFGTFGNDWGTVGVFRNTWQCTHCDIYTSTGTGSGTIDVTGDVTVGDGTETNNWLQSTFSGTLAFSGYVTGTAANGIVDSSGNLVGSYNTTYFGIAGHQVG